MEGAVCFGSDRAGPPGDNEGFRVEGLVYPIVGCKNWVQGFQDFQGFSGCFEGLGLLDVLRGIWPGELSSSLWLL